MEDGQKIHEADIAKYWKTVTKNAAAISMIALTVIFGQGACEKLTTGEDGREGRKNETSTKTHNSGSRTTEHEQGLEILPVIDRRLMNQHSQLNEQDIEMMQAQAKVCAAAREIAEYANAPFFDTVRARSGVKFDAQGNVPEGKEHYFVTFRNCSADAKTVQITCGDAKATLVSDVAVLMLPEEGLMFIAKEYMRLGTEMEGNAKADIKLRLSDPDEKFLRSAGNKARIRKVLVIERQDINKFGLGNNLLAEGIGGDWKHFIVIMSRQDESEILWFPKSQLRLAEEVFGNLTDFAQGKEKLRGRGMDLLDQPRVDEDWFTMARLFEKMAREQKGTMSSQVRLKTEVQITKHVLGKRMPA